jgi:carboxypeptidase Q
MGVQLAIDACPMAKSDARKVAMKNMPRAARLFTLATTGLVAFGAASAQPQTAVEMAQTGDDPAWAITEDLTTEIGPRLAGTEPEAAARRWAVTRLQAMGFQNVREEAFMMETWVRGEEQASLIGPFYPQKLAITTLGNSASTGPKGLEGDVIYFSSFDALVEAPDSVVKGKIVFIDNQMERAQDGSGYGFYGRSRFLGPSLASQKGAAAIVIRSIGTDNHRNPHAGVTNFADGAKPIPAGAISGPDADLLAGQWKRVQAMRGGNKPQPLRLRLLLTPRNIGQQASGNVIAEVAGSDPAASPVILACHLDSWDLGTGAIDDAAGCGIITAAAKHIMTAGQPRRTIRLLWAGAEEVGVFGGSAYFKAHGNTKHAVALESDFGADRIWRVDFKLPDSAKILADRIGAALAPFGVTRGRTPAGGGADIGALVAAGVPTIDLQQDGTHYFDLHHTPDDTLDKVDPVQLRQNVVAWTATVAILANSSDDELP